MLHVPAGVSHGLFSPQGATLVIAQDRKTGYSA
jgi:hypothetical protein